jgi:hypothetical protein
VRLNCSIDSIFSLAFTLLRSSVSCPACPPIHRTQHSMLQVRHRLQPELQSSANPSDQIPHSSQCTLGSSAHCGIRIANIMRRYGKKDSHDQLESWVTRAEALCAGESAAAAGTHGILGGLCRLICGLHSPTN